MLATTLEIIKSGLRADPSLNAGDRQRILQKIRADMTSPKTESPPPCEVRLIRRQEAARRLGCSLRLVDRLAKDGVLQKRRLPNRQRAAGFLESDLNALIAGENK
jgi:predicted DNA-binding transcriptional regulator AlpA